MRTLLTTLIAIVFAATASAADTESEKGSSEPTDEEYKKSYDLFKMKDQSANASFENKTSLGLFVGYSGAIADGGGTGSSGVNIQSNSFIFGANLMTHIHPEFNFGGFVKTSHIDDDLFGVGGWLIGFGAEGNYHPFPVFYIGSEVGLMVETRDNDPSVGFLFGPQLGVEFRLSEQFSVGAELEFPLVFGSDIYCLMNAVGMFKIWL